MRVRKRIGAAVAVVVAGSAVMLGISSRPGVGSVQAESVPDTGCGSAVLALPDDGQLIPFDIGTGALGQPIDVPGAYHITVTADGTTAWVISDHSAPPVWTLTPVDLASGAVGASTPLPFLPDAGPVSQPVITPDGSRILIGTSDKVTPIELATMQIDPSITYSDSALRSQIAVTPDGTTLFAASSTSLDLQVVDLVSGTLGPLVKAGWVPINLTVAPDGSAVYTANYNAGDVSTIGLPSLTHTATQPGLPGNQGIAVSADGSALLLASSWSVARLDLGTGVLGPVASPGIVEGVALLPDGFTALAVTISPDTVATIDLATGTVVGSVPLPGRPSDVAAIVPPQAPDAELAPPEVAADGTATLDASGSTAACGSIASYSWDFGDGSPTVRTTSATVDHAYASARAYTASVTVTDTTGTSTEKVFTGQAVVRNGGPTAVAEATVDVASVAGSVTPSFTG